jgi:hypothetical protein
MVGLVQRVVIRQYLVLFYLLFSDVPSEVHNRANICRPVGISVVLVTLGQNYIS